MYHPWDESIILQQIKLTILYFIQHYWNASHTQAVETKSSSHCVFAASHE